MYEVSELFLAAIRLPHQIVTRVELWYGYDTLLTASLAVSEGTVTLDRTADVYSSLTLTAQLINDGTGLAGAPPVDMTDVNVYGLILRPYRGIRLPDGTAELVPLGHFLVEEYKRSASDTAVEIQASGLRSYLRDARLTSPLTKTGSVGRQVLLDLIKGGLPSSYPFNYDTTEWAALSSRTLGTTVFEEDRLGAVDDLAASYGVDVFPDREGVWRFQPIEDTDTAEPVWTVNSGEGGVLIEANRSASRTSVWNVVVARGEATDSATAAVQAVASNTTSSSPTNTSGPFGQRVRFYTSSLLTTTAQCLAAARTILAKYSLADTVFDCSAVPNPALDPGDAITVVPPNGTATVYMVDAVTIPLTPDGSLAIATRQREDSEDSS